jgi:retinol dehydrogenase-12
VFYPKLADAGQKWRMPSPENGAVTTLDCATEPSIASETGLYHDQCRARTPSTPARDTAPAAELWRRSEEWVRDDKARQ